jgi:DNA mismatch repair protein MSH4
LNLSEKALQINVSHQEVVLMSANATLQCSFFVLMLSGDQAVEDLIEEVRCHMSIMFKICEAVALLDMVIGVAPKACRVGLTISDHIFCTACDDQ